MVRLKEHSPLWPLRIVIPCLMIAAFLLDAGLRFMPLDSLTFRAWEALIRDRPPSAAFAPSRRYYNARSYGDLASLGNFPGLRQYRPERFSTDALGFRNPPRALDGEVDVILAGDSFTVGSGVSDDQTLSARLTERTGCVSYNAGIEQDRVTSDLILALARRLHLRHRLVIRPYVEDAETPPHQTRRAILTSTLVARTPARILNAIGWLRGLLTVSPLQSLSTHAWKAVANDKILPNRYAATVVRATLDNGDTVLFQAAQIRNFYHRRRIDIDYWSALRDDLHRERLDLLVVLVPGKYRVYRPFLIDQSSVDRGAGDLDRLGHLLRAIGIPVLDLTPVLSTEAAAAYRERGEYLYWLDDIHWNRRGIALAAEAIEKEWPLARGSCRSPAAQKPDGS